VAGAALLGLEDELDAGVFDCGFYAIGFVADDAEDVACRDYGFGGGDDVEEEGATADLVEDLGALAFEAGAFSHGQFELQKWRLSDSLFSGQVNRKITSHKPTSWDCRSEGVQ
jgi:hypothetical protein